MANDVSDAFVRQYESDVHHQYQKMGGKLRPFVQEKTGVIGTSTTFQKIGTGNAVQKSRHGMIASMNPDHTPIECAVNDWYAAEYVDVFDELKMTINERQAMVEVGVRALGRKTDQQIITALDTTTQTSAQATGVLSLARVTEAFETLGNNGVFESGRMVAIVDYEGWSDLLGIDAFSDADKVGFSDLPFLKHGEARMWMGTTWFPHELLTDFKSSTTHKGFWWNFGAIGHAVGAGVKTRIDYVPEKGSNFVNNMMSMGACMIDTLGVFELQFTGS